MYTYVTHGGRFYAVGAAHCAFYCAPPFAAKSHRFVTLPRRITDGAVALFTAHSVTEDQRAGDFVAVELATNPLGDGAYLPPWPAFDASRH